MNTAIILLIVDITWSLLWIWHNNSNHFDRNLTFASLWVFDYWYHYYCIMNNSIYFYDNLNVKLARRESLRGIFLPFQCAACHYGWTNCRSKNLYIYLYTLGLFWVRALFFVFNSWGFTQLTFVIWNRRRNISLEPRALESFSNSLELEKFEYIHIHTCIHIYHIQSKQYQILQNNIQYYYYSKCVAERNAWLLDIWISFNSTSEMVNVLVAPLTIHNKILILMHLIIIIILL